MSAEESHGRIYDSAGLLAIAFPAAALAGERRSDTRGPLVSAWSRSRSALAGGPEPTGLGGNIESAAGGYR